MNRPDKVWNKLSVAEKEIGGIPNSSEDIKQAHAAAIEMYIQSCVGHIEEGGIVVRVISGGWDWRDCRVSALSEVRRGIS